MGKRDETPEERAKRKEKEKREGKSKKEKKRDDDEESEVVVKYETLPRDATTPIGGPRTRALSVRVNAWVRERREHREEAEEKGGEVYAFVENDSEALMYFAAMSKETRGGATESLYDDVSFAMMTGVGFDSDDDEEEKNSAEDGKRSTSEKMLDDMEARWMRMESRKRAETLEMTSLERRLEEIRDKRIKSAAEIRIAREMGISYADELRVGVVMTHKNRPEYCEKAVEALLRQTHRKVEIVIVDDGSEEVHVKRLEKFVDSKKDNNKSVKLEKLAKPGKYLGEARNFGCSKLSEKTTSPSASTLK